METILIQDDDEAIADIVITALSMEGYRACRLAGDDENILEMIRSYQANLIVLDCWLGKQSVKLCNWIKAHVPLVPVIAFSCDSQIGQNFSDMGFDGYLGKPFDLQELYSTGRKFIPSRRKRQPAEQQLKFFARFYFDAMATRKTSKLADLKTEGPLKEKDQQGQAIEQQQKLSEIALAKWRQLKEKIKHSLKR